MRGFLNGGRVDDTLRPRGKRPFVPAFVEDLPGFAVLAERDLRHVLFIKTPDAPIAEFPAGLGQPVQVFGREGVNEILIRAMNKNAVGLLGEGQLGDHGVGVARRRTQHDLPSRRRKSIGGQVRSRHDVLYEFRDAQVGERLEQQLNVVRHPREIFRRPSSSRSCPSVAG